MLVKKAVDFFKEKTDLEDLTSVPFLCILISYIEETSKETPEFLDKITKILDDYHESLQVFLTANPKEKTKEKSTEKTVRDWSPEAFDEIEFVTNKNEVFLKNSQVFLCYGSGFSNKKLLKDYGFCIEYNKYDKVFLNIFPATFFCEESPIFSQFLKKIEYFPYFQQFKLKYTSFNANLVIFFKIFLFNFEENRINEIFFAKNLDFEIKALEKILGFLRKLSFSQHSLQENEKLLFDAEIGYNHYFSVVYKLEKQRIAQFNIKLIDIVLTIMRKIREGMSKAQAFSEKTDYEESQEEFARNRYVLSPYMKKWQF